MTDVLDAEQVAVLLRVKPGTATAWGRHGKIPAHKVGDNWLFLYDEIVVWIAEHSATGVRRKLTVPNTTTTLYRHFDADDGLLYVGVTSDLTRRSGEHKYSSDWFSESVRVEAEIFSTRHAALEAESLAIRTEYPLFNILP